MDLAKLPNLMPKTLAAEALGISTHSLNIAIADGQIEVVRIGRRDRVVKTSILKMLEGGQPDGADSTRRPIIPGKVKGVG